MPGEEGGMRSLGFASGCHRLAGAIDNRFHVGSVIDLPRDQDVEIIARRDARFGGAVQSA